LQPLSASQVHQEDRRKVRKRRLASGQLLPPGTFFLVQLTEAVGTYLWQTELPDGATACRKSVHALLAFPRNALPMRRRQLVEYSRTLRFGGAPRGLIRRGGSITNHGVFLRT
jgi:hypothetical protein